jgi:S-adenosylmethionine/arginine decarboxylase-like enzyme
MSSGKQLCSEAARCIPATIRSKNAIGNFAIMLPGKDASWGKHLCIDAAGCVPITIRSKHTISDFARTLVKRIDMVPFGDPQVVHFGTGNKAGYTLVQLIETSNITAHFVEETNDMYLDVFSCKEFDPKVVEKLVDQYFCPKLVKKTMLTRQAPILQ